LKIINKRQEVTFYYILSCFLFLFLFFLFEHYIQNDDEKEKSRRDLKDKGVIKYKIIIAIIIDI
jgi:hypothetical protein